VAFEIIILLLAETEMRLHTTRFRNKVDGFHMLISAYFSLVFPCILLVVLSLHHLTEQSQEFISGKTSFCTPQYVVYSIVT